MWSGIVILSLPILVINYLSMNENEIQELKQNISKYLFQLVYFYDGNKKS